MKQIKSPSTVLHDSVTLPHTSFDTSSRARSSPTPLLLLHVCSTTINGCWNPKNFLCEALGLEALQQSFHTHVLKVPTASVIEEFPVFSKKEDGGEQRWMVTEKVKNNEKARDKMWLDKPVVQIPTLPHMFFPRACTSSVLQSSKDLRNLGEHHISWGALDSFPGSLCLWGHPSTWSYNFISLRSSMCFLQCHHLKEVPLLCYSLLQHL